MTHLRSPRVRRLLLPLVALAVAPTIAGCGGSSPGVSAPTPTASGSPGGTTPSASSSPSSAASVAPVPVESNPPGDIPDNLAFVGYRSRSGGYSFTHPEGWARSGRGRRVQFTDKLNGVAVTSLAATSAPTVASARSTDVARIRAAVPAFRLRSITAVSVPAGHGVRIVFRRNSAPNQVTGKVYRDEVEEYAVFAHGRVVLMDLYGPVGADNVDAYRTMSQSLRIP
jgi:hypothetical protein